MAKYSKFTWSNSIRHSDSSFLCCFLASCWCWHNITPQLWIFSSCTSSFSCTCPSSYSCSCTSSCTNSYSRSCTSSNWRYTILLSWNKLNQKMKICTWAVPLLLTNEMEGFNVKILDVGDFKIAFVTWNRALNYISYLFKMTWLVCCLYI